MIRIVTDSVASLPKSLLKERNIEVVSLYVNRDGKEYLDAEMDVDEFYAEIADMVNSIPTSSQPSRETFEKVFMSAAEAGDEVLGIFISKLMSGTFEGAAAVAEECRKTYPDFKSIIVDSASNSSDEAFAVLDAADARDAGATLEDCADIALSAVLRSRFLFAPETMAFLQAGGRIGKAAALVGGLLKIVPILTVFDGEAKVFGKARTMQKALDTMKRTLEKDKAALGLKRLVVHYIGDSEPAKEWAKKQIEPIVGHEVPVRPVSPVIGVHVGPSVGVAYECEQPVEGKYESDLSELLLKIG